MLNVYEQAILRLLKTARRPLTTAQVATKVGISWETSRKYLEQLNQKRYISVEHHKNRIYWKSK